MILSIVVAEFSPWVLGLIGGGLGGFLGAYLSQKGKNLATKEDISKITHDVESVKISLSDKSHVARANYDRERNLYQELWKDVMSLSERITDREHRMDYHEGLKTYVNAEAALFEKISEHRPFAESKILSLFEELIRDLGRWAASKAGTDECKQAFCDVGGAMNRVEEAIRERLKNIPGSVED